MCLQIGLLEPFPGPTGQHGRRIGAQPEQRCDRTRRGVLDGGVPQHGLPPLGQAPEGLHGQRLVGLAHRPDVRALFEGVVPGQTGQPAADLGSRGRLLREHREVLDEMLPPGRLRPGRRDPPHGRQQIRAHRLVRPGPAPYRLQRPGEHLRGQVFGRVPVTAARPRVAPYRIGVPEEQLLVRPVVAPAHPGDQLAVGRWQLAAGAPRHRMAPARFALGRDLAFGPGARLGPAAGATERAGTTERLFPTVNAHRGSPRPTHSPGTPFKRVTRGARAEPLSTPSTRPGSVR